MLLLLLSAGDQRYAIDTAHVVEVVPEVELRAVPKAPEYVAGLFSYHGVMVPVVDLCCLMAGRRCRRRLSTRIVLVDYLVGNGTAHVLGLMAENVMETMKVAEADLAPANLKVEQAPYLSEVVLDDQGIIQLLRVERVLPESLRRSLFSQTSGEE